MSDSLRLHGLQHTRLPCPLPTPRVCSNSYSSSLWCNPTFSSSVVPFSPCLQSSPASGSFPISPFFTSSGQSIGVSASAPVFPTNIRNWFPLGWTGVIPLQSNGLSGVFYSTTIHSKASIPRHSAFFLVLLSLLYMTARKTIVLTIWTFAG